VLPGKTYTLDEIVRILKHRWWLILVPLVLGTTAGVLGYKWLPVEYRSETLIMVIPQRVPDTYVKSTVTTNVEDRLRSIGEQIQSRSRLERIIQDLDLYKDRRRTGALEDAVLRMRDDIDLKLEGKDSSFRVSYIHSDPKIAQKVTERLAALYIEENLRDRENLADSTSSFLESQLQEAKRRLIEQEKKLEEYRRRYAGQLPSQLQGNLQALQSAQMQLQSLGESMNRARERRLLVERQIADAQTLPVDVVLPGIPVASPEAPPLLPATQQLEAARARLDEARLRYTRDHPDVVALEQTIRDLQARVEEEARRPPEPVPDKPLLPSEVARQKRISDLQAELKVIDLQLAAGQTEEARLKASTTDYNARISVVPTRESELVELTRDYSTLQETYSSLLLKREDSKLAANLERRQIGEQFRILDPASLPARPHNQKQRLAVLAGGVLGGLAVGLLLVGFLEYRDSTFKLEDDVHRVLDLPVLALIPVMEPEDEAAVGRRRGQRPAGGLSAVLILIVCSAAALIVWRLQS
jgi:polysaccharide chain length determinant protein (PEP-CTERM system associated)